MCRGRDVELADILGVLDDPGLVVYLSVNIEAEDLNLGVLGCPCQVISDLDVNWHRGNFWVRVSCSVGIWM